MQALKIIINAFCLRKEVPERRALMFPPNYTTACWGLHLETYMFNERKT